MYRPITLMVFDWLKFIKLYDFVLNVRSFLYSSKESIPNWVIFSFPDGLWIYSLTFAICVIWDGYKNNSLFWILIIVILGVGGEIGQLFNVIQGTFDLSDLLFYFLGLLFAITIFHYKKERID